MGFRRLFGDAHPRWGLCPRLVRSAPRVRGHASPILDGVLAQTKESFTHLTLLAIEAALQAGEILRRGFGTQFTISSKVGIHNLVTEYDHKAEKCIIDFLKSEAPHSHFLAEESGETGAEQKDLVWIIDPLDGTVNF